MITEARLRAAILKATYRGVTTRTIQRLLRLADCHRVPQLPLTKRRDFLEVLGALGKKPGGEP